MKRKRIVLILLSAAIAFGAAGMAGAQPPEQRPRQDQRNGEQRGPRGEIRRPRQIVNGVRRAVTTVGEAAGLNPRTVVELLGQGKTLAEIVTENNGSVENVSAELLAPLRERVAAAVESGRITQERADELLAIAGDQVDELLNRVFERLTDRGIPRRRGQPNDNEI